ncbi:cholinesterase 1-like [Mercenaria mercenaria]|uniref:cholinesterase 1-like n=1 Tax=Mercenaria mercenaria TaxID=6596 RepID=UPI00234EDFE4|nr:cholinesterase 1-like [Mercenaria mercenaria]
MISVSVVLLLFVQFASTFLVPDGLQIVHTQYGEIHGQLSSATFDGMQYQVKTFLGIPYAEPPIGNFRFRKPVPKLNFPTPFKASAYGPICPQDALDKSVPQSEDCLFLNVFVPTRHGAGVLPKPVMIWIHGGGFYAGSANRFKAEVLSAFSDVVVVTINYRLGPLGFFTTKDNEALGNYGMWDQHLAFQWVKGNIASFGGDVENITIFGESAGGASVVFQTLYPGNRDVFQRAISESGTAAGPSVSHGNTVYKKSIEFAASVGCSGPNHSTVVSCMRHKSSDEIKKAVQVFMPKNYDEVHPNWVPVYDNDFVVSETQNILREASKSSPAFSSYHNIGLLIGMNNYDGALFLPFWMSQFNITSPKDYRVSQAQFKYVFMPRLAELILKETATNLVRDAIIQEYTDWDHPDDDTVRLERLVTMATDCSYYAPTVLTANSHANDMSNTYVYRFHAAPPTRLLPLPPSLDLAGNSNHADDIFFLFGFNDLYTDLFYPNPAKAPKPSSDQIKLSKALMTMWSNFAKSGNPNKPMNVKSLYDVEWQPYDVKHQNYLDISFNMNPQSMKTRLASRADHFWNTVLPAMQKASKH